MSIEPWPEDDAEAEGQKIEARSDAEDDVLKWWVERERTREQAAR